MVCARRIPIGISDKNNSPLVAHKTHKQIIRSLFFEVVNDFLLSIAETSCVYATEQKVLDL